MGAPGVQSQSPSSSSSPTSKIDTSKFIPTTDEKTKASHIADLQNIRKYGIPSSKHEDWGHFASSPWIYSKEEALKNYQDISNPNDKDPLRWGDPEKRQAAIRLRVDRILANPKFQALSDSDKKIVLGDYYDTILKPGYTDIGFPVPERENWITNIPKEAGKSTPGEYFPGLWSRIGNEIFSGTVSAEKSLYSLAGLSLSNNGLYAILDLPHLLHMDPDSSKIAYVADSIEQHIQKTADRFSHASFDSANFWLDTHQSEHMIDQIGSGVAENLLLFPLWKTLGQARGEALAMKLPGMPEGISGLNMSKALMKNPFGGFLLDRIGESWDVYAGSLLTGSNNKEAINNAIGMAALGTITGGISPLAKKAGLAFLSKLSYIGGVVYLRALADQAAHEIDHGIIGWTADRKPVQIRTTLQYRENLEKLRRESKMVDPKTGQPMTFYHGTTATFKDFKGNRNIRAETEEQDRWLTYRRESAGFYFTSNPSLASDYATRVYNKPGGANVRPVHLNFKNPFRTTEDMWHITDAEVADLEARGYDSIIGSLPPGQEHSLYSEYIAFHPEQIVSKFDLGELGSEGYVQVGHETHPFANEQEKNFIINKFVKEDFDHDPARSKSIHGVKLNLAVLTQRLFPGRNFYDLTPAEKQSLFKGYIDQVDTAVQETTIHNGDLVEQQTQQNLDAQRQSNPIVAKLDADFEKSTGIKIAGAAVKAEQEKVAQETGSNHTQNTVNDISHPADVGGGARPKAAADIDPRERIEQPRRFASFKENFISYFRNITDKMKEDARWSKQVHAMEPEEFADLIREYSPDIKWEKPEHALFWANAFRNNLEAPIRNKLVKVLHEMFPKEWQKVWDKKSDNMLRHLDLLARSGRLYTEGNVFRSTQIEDPQDITGSQRKLYEEVEKAELDKLRSAMSGNPAVFAQAAQRLATLQGFRARSKSYEKFVQNSEKIEAQYAKIAAQFGKPEPPDEARNIIAGVAPVDSAGDYGRVNLLSNGMPVVRLPNRAMMDIAIAADWKFANGWRIHKNTVPFVMSGLSARINSGVDVTTNSNLHYLLEKAHEASDHRGVIVIKKGTPLAQFLSDMREEIMHGWQARFTGSTRTHLDPEQFDNLYLKLPRATISMLMSRGYENIIHKMVTETSAKIMYGNLRDVAMTSMEAAGWIDEYFFAIEQKWGKDALRTITNLRGPAKAVRKTFTDIPSDPFRVKRRGQPESALNLKLGEEGEH